MNNSLAPTYQRRFGDFWILWFKTSNSYSVIDEAFKILLDDYVVSDSVAAFTAQIGREDQTSDPKTIAEHLKSYLKSCNEPPNSLHPKAAHIDTSRRSIVKHYAIKGKVIRLYCDSELVLKTVHPALAHLSVEVTSAYDVTFDIYVKDKQLFLFKDEQLIRCVPQRDYHLIQGTFIMHFLCTTHQKVESDWLGSFHGSTLTDGHSSLLFVGASGKGKSTLCALLATQGFDLLADDVSPMLAASQHMFYNPSAISIKAGAFSILQPLVDGFKDVPTIQFNKSKGPIKYIPCKAPKADSYPCYGIVLVNYKAKAETKLEPGSIKTLLETLIPDSWLSPNPVHAKAFLDWLDRVRLYELTYSDTQSVTVEVSQLFKTLNKINTLV